MTKITMNDRLHSRGRRHQNVFAAPAGDGAVLIQFTGESIPGVATIASEKFTKDGKWSHTTWTVDLADNVRWFQWDQDFGTGEYLTSKTWETAIEEVRRESGMPDLDADAITRYVRATLPDLAASMDKAATPVASAAPAIIAAQQALASAQAEKSAAEAELAAALAEIAEELQLREEAAAELAEAQAIKDQAAKARAALASAKGGSMSLADLKAMLG